MKASDVFKGLEVITKYDPGADFLIDDDLILCGNFTKTVEAMTQDERHVMDEIGWFEDEEKNTWSRYV